MDNQITTSNSILENPIATAAIGFAAGAATMYIVNRYILNPKPAAAPAAH